MIAPFLWAVWTSFTSKMIGISGKFIGLKNYIDLLSEPLFGTAVLNTLVFTVGAMAGKMIMGTCIALMMNQNIRGKNIYRSLLLLPWTVPVVVAVYTWKWMLSDIGGVFNSILISVGVIEEAIPWLGVPHLAMSSVIMVSVWRGTPFIAVSVFAGLQTISNDLYDAAKIDGANVYQRFLSITLPSIKNVLLLSGLVMTIWTLNSFQVIWLLTGGGPANSTQVIGTLSYTIGFRNLRLAKAIAISVYSFPPLILLVNRVTKMTLAD
jgi:multiple sugar transport system permease protein